MLEHPSSCSECQRLRRLTRTRLFLENPRTVSVKSWCRICGFPVYLQVITDYELAMTNFNALDDQPMAHKTIHAEAGGWGWHWRLDEVMRSIFPRHEDAWVAAPWYSHNESMDQKVTVFWRPEEAERFAHADMNVEIRMLQAWINRHPRSRDELNKLCDEVWDSQELARRFEVLGFKAPYAIVRDKRTGTKGSVLFQHEPRLYFGFDADRVI